MRNKIVFHVPRGCSKIFMQGIDGMPCPRVGEKIVIEGYGRFFKVVDVQHQVRQDGQGNHYGMVDTYIMTNVILDWAKKGGETYV